MKGKRKNSDDKLSSKLSSRLTLYYSQMQHGYFWKVLLGTVVSPQNRGGRESTSPPSKYSYKNQSSSSQSSSSPSSSSNSSSSRSSSSSEVTPSDILVIPPTPRDPHSHNWFDTSVSDESLCSILRAVITQKMLGG